MNLHDLVHLYYNGNISKIKLSREISACDELIELYPIDILPAAKFFMHINNMSINNVICDREDSSPKRFKSLNAGFQKYCGNQSDCVCNKENADQCRKNKTSNQKNTINSKRKATNISRYGYEFASQHPDVKTKAEQTCITRYGFKSATMNIDILLKSQETCMENHGVLFPQQNKEIVDKTENTFTERYGASRPAKNPEIARKTTIKYKSQIYNNVIAYRTTAIPLFDVDEYANADNNHEFKWRCNKCDTEYYQQIKPGLNPKCYKCEPEDVSWGENLIAKWLTEHNIEYQTNIRSIISPYELDFYIPSHNTAIEFNGLYWHSEIQGKNKSYHYSKHLACDNQNIKLLHIFEHELKHKEEIVFGRLNSAFNNINKTIGARKLLIRQVLAPEARVFFNNNHLQGYTNSKITFGLFDGEEMLSGMSFGKSRFNKNIEWELIRFASKNNVGVPGAGSRLFKHFVKTMDPTSVLSYANLSWGKGNFYEYLGFEFSHRSTPNHWYFKGLDVNHRSKFQKHKLPKELYYLGSAWEIMKFMGYNRFWDCGNNVWIWKKK